MTEAEWLESADPWTMLNFLKGKASDRKLRLFGCACCRRVEHHFRDARSHKAVEIVERWADQRASDHELDEVRNLYRSPRSLTGFVYSEIGHIAVRNAHHAASVAAYESMQIAFFWPLREGGGVDLTAADCIRSHAHEKVVHSGLLRDIFGNPFRPVAPDPTWLTPAASLAQKIYGERAFDRMPELADALERAGCTDANVLSHCRGPGPHVRGCWVVDLVLGKT